MIRAFGRCHCLCREATSESSRGFQRLSNLGTFASTDLGRVGVCHWPPPENTEQLRLRSAAASQWNERVLIHSLIETWPSFHWLAAILRLGCRMYDLGRPPVAHSVRP